jgi:hypothetical protein
MYKKEQFSNLAFNPFCTEHIVHKFPKLESIIPDDTPVDDVLDTVLRYIILMYDPQSILVREEKDLNHRRTEASILSGLNKFGEEFELSVQEFDYEPALELTVRYLVRFAKSREFAAICALEYKYWESIKKLCKPIKEDTANQELQAVQKKAVISEEIDKDIKRLENYYKLFYGEDAVLEKKAKKGTRPEDYAQIKK